MLSQRNNHTRERILACAQEIYLEYGIAGLTMRAVGRCAGVTAPAIYRHFGGKEDLLIALSEQAFARFASFLWQALREHDAWSRLTETARQYAEFGLTHAADYRIIFMSPCKDLGYEAVPAAGREQFGSTFQFLVDRVRECLEAQLLAPGNPVELSATIWAHCHGLVSLYLDGHMTLLQDDDEFRAFYADSLTRLANGLRQR